MWIEELELFTFDVLGWPKSLPIRLQGGELKEGRRLPQYSWFHPEVWSHLTPSQGEVRDGWRPLCSGPVTCFCKRGRKAYYLRAATSFIRFHKGPKGFQMATQIQGSQKCMRRRSSWVPVTKVWFSRGWSVRGHRSSWVCILTTLLSFLAS